MLTKIENGIEVQCTPEEEAQIRAEWTINEENNKILLCKSKAKDLLAAFDWAVLPDVGLKNYADFVTYRGILRGYATTPVVDPVWPVEPTPVWQ